MAREAAAAYGPIMTSDPTQLERAFSLARSGKYAGITEIRAQLRAEGYSATQLEGPTLLKQLRALCIATRASSEA
jgi:hypothetical protein